MIRVCSIDDILGDQLWCYELEDAAKEYNASIQYTHKYVLDFIWYVRR